MGLGSSWSFFHDVAIVLANSPQEEVRRAVIDRTRRFQDRCCLRRLTNLSAFLFVCLLLAWPRTGRAQVELGCCQFQAIREQVPARRCATLTRSQCDALRPLATFFRGQRCDTIRQRCVFQLGPTAVPTPPWTATPRPTPSPTATATPEARGCCEVAASRAIPYPFCGNDITASACFDAFGFRAWFCPECTCSSHDTPGFLLAPGGCVRPSPTPTVRLPVTPTQTPSARLTPRGTLTPTPTATAAVGCCEVPLSTANRTAFICGNAISRSACLQGFAGANFCPSCQCSSHNEAGFGTRPGRCVPLRAPRPPRPTRAAR